MKKFFFLMTAVALITSCKDETSLDSAPGDSTVAKTSTALPYTASYSSSFEMGNDEYSAKILGGWKDWESNNIDNIKSWAADTIVAYHSDNSMVKGVDNLIADWKAARAKYSSVIDTIDAVMPVYSTDKKENWVLVWATEISTKTDGTKDTASFMETWRINKDGKADLLLQYDRKKRK